MTRSSGWNRKSRRSVTSPTLGKTLHWQELQRELGGKRYKLRRELFDCQDDVELQRNDLIA